MTSVNRTIKSFACPTCGLGYLGIKKPFPFERAGRFDCIVCNTEVHSWCGNYDFDHWKFTAVSWDTADRSTDGTAHEINRTGDSR
jgi:hypothetical protein